MLNVKYAKCSILKQIVQPTQKQKSTKFIWSPINPLVSLSNNKIDFFMSVIPMELNLSKNAIATQ